MQRLTRRVSVIRMTNRRRDYRKTKMNPQQSEVMELVHRNRVVRRRARFWVPVSRTADVAGTPRWSL